MKTRQDLSDLSLPSNDIGEKGLLCSIIQNTAIYLDHEDQIGEHLFQSPANKKIFAVVRDLCPQFSEIDFVAIIGELTRKAELEEVGGKEAVNEIYGFVTTSAGWRTYYEQAFEAHRLRQIKLTARQIWEAPDLETAQQAAESLSEIATLNIKAPVPFKERLHDTLERIERLATTPPQSVVRFGIPGLDEALLPIEPGDQIVICAETSRGKSALAAQAVLSSLNQSFAIFSLEMPAWSLVVRMLASEARVPFSNLRRGRLIESDYPRLTDAVSRLGNRTVWIEDEHPISPATIAAKCRRFKRSGLDAIVVDYLQLVAPIAPSKRDTREHEVAEISGSLKRLALELNLVVIALSQVNEHGQTRETRAIGHDADIMLMIGEGEDGMFIEIRKQRNGPLCLIPVTFDGSTLRFSAPSKTTTANVRNPAGEELL